VISGMEIELDRQLIDRLGDPLLHLLRNAVDHGIEDPDQRERAGKPRHGHISLSARQDAGSVIIEVSDDGGGIALDAIRDKVLKKGLVPAEQIQALSESEVIDLIFLPGLSTSAIISDVSGRGVGMDVVKRCIVDELQGVVEVDSRPGNGTRFTLRLPLSLAMMRVLLVEAGGQVFGFTGQQIARIVQLPAERMMEVAQRQVVVVDKEFIPVVTLSDLLSLPSRQYASDENVLLAVVQVRSEKLAIRIDALLDERDMVIKPLPPHLEYLDMVSGMVMTGDNALVSVLHAPILLDHARKARSGVPAEDQPGQGRRVEPHILVVDDSLNTREIERDVLEAHGYRVTLAEDGRDGLFKARQKVFDAVLTDVEMPNMDGFSLTTALREDERYHAVPIIIITSRQKEEDRRRGVEVGADAYIVKGDFDQSNLIEILKNIVG
jgi:two-component system chemotaxis sensor kinase CheA